MTKAPIQSGSRCLADRLATGVVLGDGGYLLELEHRGYVQAGPFTPEVVLQHPEALHQLHVEFARAGADVLQALTFYADDRMPGSSAWSVSEVNRQAVALAREAAGDDLMVAGTLTQTVGFKPRQRELAARATRTFAWQLEAQCQAGVDLVIAETFRFLAEARLALAAINAAGLPAMITLNLGPAGTGDGASAGESARVLGGEGAAVVGVNCNWDPTVSLAIAREMLAAAPAGVAVACQPVGYRTSDPAVPFVSMPEFPLGLEPLQLGRHHLARFARDGADAGIAYIGGCCGVQPYHVRAMAEALGRTPSASAKSPDLSSHVLPEVRDRAAGNQAFGDPDSDEIRSGAPVGGDPRALRKRG